MVLDDGQGIQLRLLLGLGLDLRNERRQVRRVLLGLSPFRLREQLVGDGGLHSAAEAEDSVVALLGREALEGEGDGLVLLGDEVVGSAGEKNGQPGSSCIVPTEVPGFADPRGATVR